MAAEEDKKQEYIADFLSMDFKWWKKEIAKLRSPQPGKDEIYFMNQRLLGFLGLAVYSYSGKAMRENQPEAAGKYLNIYLELEPGNAEAHYLSAVLAARNKDEGKAYSYLQSAVRNGFDDYNRLRAENDFAPLQKEQKFISILDNIHQKNN